MSRVVPFKPIFYQLYEKEYWVECDGIHSNMSISEFHLVDVVSGIRFGQPEFEKRFRLDFPEISDEDVELFILFCIDTELEKDKWIFDHRYEECLTMTERGFLTWGEMYCRYGFNEPLRTNLRKQIREKLNDGVYI